MLKYIYSWFGEVKTSHKACFVPTIVNLQHQHSLLKPSSTNKNLFKTRQNMLNQIKNKYEQ
jgi:hypothetical protein